MSQEQNTTFKNMKRNLTLDLNQKKLNLPTTSGLLSSPDLNLLKVDTPELESMILANGIGQTPTPSLLFPRAVTAEQEKFAGGFVEALSHLHNSNSQQGSDSNSSTIYNDSFLPHIKEEPQTVPSLNQSPPMSPVNMEYQERIKLERKRQRNRLAASKCRSRKLERISKLEDKVKILKSENIELGNIVNQLKETVGLLKLEVIEHNKAGCPIINTY
ncbi:transcription factor Jun [Diorhabda carinulata]|uniref:transcription factor Jun n=1 Tax=Diorhabda sublineata TaxID=1163346 RepID=UPI0024E09CA4|nr:transcription factor Jun [Diorhabda sublineata]XP_057672508.1 transcription factor Jun [Diorhabda carinulata]